MADQIQAITMPKWGMEMSEGVISEWHKSEGDKVKTGEDVVDIETAKIVNTLTSHSTGVLRRIVGQPGETLAVGKLLGVLAGADTSDEDIDQFIADFSPEEAAEEIEEAEPASKGEAPEASQIEEPLEKPIPSTPEEGRRFETVSSKAESGKLGDLAEGPDDSDVHATPVARRLARQLGVNLHNVEATGRHDRVTKADLEKAVVGAGGEMPSPPPARSAARSTKPGPQDDSVRATPVARRLAKELGVSLAECRVSGDRHRVCKADVEAAAALKGKAKPGAAEPAAAPSAEAPEFEEVPLTGMRKTIAARLQESKQTAPHYRVQIDADIDDLLAARRQINDANTDVKVSVNDFIVKACATALMKVPELNVQFDGQTVRRFADADIAVAVALDDGLITPIVKKANQKGLIAISNEVRDLATRAKLGKLKSQEFQGGTFSVSNLGMFGIKQFDAIINPPQAAILAIGASELRPVIRDGELTSATVLSLSLSSDHRIVDGALAARFLGVLKGFLERPATMLG